MTFFHACPTPVRIRFILKVIIITYAFIILVTVSTVKHVSFQRILKCQNSSSHRDKPLCSMDPPDLLGKFDTDKNITLEEAEVLFRNSVDFGGTFSPIECTSRFKVAVLIPYRNRKDQMGPFMKNIHMILQKQKLEYALYVIEQADSYPFNRAALLNIGFVEAQKERKYDCIVFHDVDLLSENDRHLYHCSAMPRLMNVADSKHDYKLLNYVYFGGVSSIMAHQFREVNGYSNRYWGWGGEDDDMKARLLNKGYIVWRFPKAIARFTMLTHANATRNENRMSLLKSFKKRISVDGLNSLNYKSINIEKRPLFTHIKVHLISDDWTYSHQMNRITEHPYVRRKSEEIAKLETANSNV